MHRDHILIKAKGQVLIIAIIFLAVILILTATMFSKVSSFLRFGNISAQASQATALAEAGVDNTVWLLNTNGGNCPAACTTETTLGTIGTFKVTVVENSPNLKTITSTGYVPGSTNPKSKRTVKVQVGIDSTIIAFNYAAQTGEGGALMNQSSTIEGSIYSNGSISKGDGNGQHITGNAYAVGAIDSGILIDGSINPSTLSRSKLCRLERRSYKPPFESNHQLLHRPFLLRHQFINIDWIHKIHRRSYNIKQRHSYNDRPNLGFKR